MYPNRGIMQAIVSMVMGLVVPQRASKVFTAYKKNNFC
jgi:hypothetical protein